MIATEKNEQELTAQPPGLSREGRTAYDVVLKFLKEKGLDHTGGCRLFYSPAEWKARGEKYGTSSHLVIVYDGADARHALSFDGAEELASMCEDVYEQDSEASPYRLFEELQERLAKHGLHSEECTGWYAAVYSS